MSKSPKRAEKRYVALPATVNSPSPGDFDEVLQLIDSARTRAVSAVNTTLIELYWSIGQYRSIGQYISRKTAEDVLGQGNC